MKRIEDIVLIVVFVLLSAFPLLNFILLFDPTPYMLENRRLVTDPGFENMEDAVANFPEKFEPYFIDQFGFRRFFVRVSNYLNSRIVSDMVLVGKDGWLYRHMQYYYWHEYPMPEKDLKIARDSLLTKQRWLAERGIKHVFVISSLRNQWKQASLFPK